jgi:hypothetical protein
MADFGGLAGLVTKATTPGGQNLGQSVFTIIELKRQGAITPGASDAGTGERFDWTAGYRQAKDLTKGGARACPIKPWPLSGQMRTVRTDYPGARTPSEQVLGPQHDPFALHGRWDDRYNFQGYAVEEMRRFEAMCRRGNLVRFQFQGQVFEGLIKSWRFQYKMNWLIEYEFQVSVHLRTGEDDLTDRSPETTPTPSEDFDKINVGVQAAADAHDTAPKNAIGGSIFTGSTSALDALINNRDVLGQTLDQHDIGPTATLDTRAQNPFKRIATQFRAVASSSAALAAVTTDARSDTSLGLRTPLSVLGFESWSRSVRFITRTVLRAATIAAQNADSRDEPTATRLYRPHAGESLYAISRQFYGTPHAWRLIADRNRLRTFQLDGTELLIIPERGQG